jgi:hypothetical protein
MSCPLQRISGPFQDRLRNPRGERPILPSPSLLMQSFEWKALWMLKPLLKIPSSPSPALTRESSLWLKRQASEDPRTAPWSYQDSHHFESQSLEAAAHGSLLQAAIQALLRVPRRQLWRETGSMRNGRRTSGDPNVLALGTPPELDSWIRQVARQQPIELPRVLEP